MIEVSCAMKLIIIFSGVTFTDDQKICQLMAVLKLREGFKNPSNGNLPLRGTEHIVFLPTHRFGPFFTDFFGKRGVPLVRFPNPLYHNEVSWRIWLGTRVFKPFPKRSSRTYKESGAHIDLCGRTSLVQKFVCWTLTSGCRNWGPGSKRGIWKIWISFPYLAPPKS